MSEITCLTWRIQLLAAGVKLSNPSKFSLQLVNTVMIPIKSCNLYSLHVSYGLHRLQEQIIHPSRKRIGAKDYVLSANDEWPETTLTGVTPVVRWTKCKLEPNLDVVHTTGAGVITHWSENQMMISIEDSPAKQDFSRLALVSTSAKVLSQGQGWAIQESAQYESNPIPCTDKVEVLRKVHSNNRSPHKHLAGFSHLDELHM